MEDASIRRRIAIIWMLLLFNAMPWIGVPTVVSIPQRVAQAAAALSLILALLLALGLNPRLQIRPSLVLFLFTVLLAAALITGVRGTAGLGAVLRAGRLAVFLAVLWLLTPWWGRRDLLLARCHLTALTVVLGSVVVGLVIAPSVALGGPDGRLVGALWPIWPTAVGHFAALAAGMAIVLWLSGSLGGTRTVLLGSSGVALVLLSHTRVALLALSIGLACATFSLLLARRRARRAVTIALAVLPLCVVALSPAIMAWFARGQSGEELRELTGRRAVWAALVAEPRPEFNQWLGFGLSDKGFFGRSIDNSWLAIYQEQGLFGIGIVGSILLFLLLAPAFRPASAARAMAIFIVVYCAIDSYTEVGLGDASSYLLDLVVAASLIATRLGDEETSPEEVPP